MLNRLEREDIFQSRSIFLWSLLGFQAGYINAFGFLACGRYVSHVTGFGTQIGVALGSKNVAFALELVGFPLSYILGSFFSGMMTSVRLEKKQKPRFDLLMALVPFLLFALLVSGEEGWFGLFGEQLVQTRDFILLFLLSFICGMQNGCFAVLTKGQIRTTHLTGIATDIGTDLARTWFGKLAGPELHLTRRANFCRMATFSSFTLGSVLSVIFSQKIEYASLIVPLVVSALIFVAVRFSGKFFNHGSVA